MLRLFVNDASQQHQREFSACFYFSGYDLFSFLYVNFSHFLVAMECQARAATLEQVISSTLFN